MNEPSPDRSPETRRALRGALVAFGLVLFAGMLFWTKLRVIENIPRSAYADPEAEATEVERDAAPAPGDPTDEADSPP